MGNLPSVRLQQTRPFNHVGIDYAGPLYVRLTAGRGRKSQRCYIVIFVCLTVKAVHLEVASDYSTPTFLAAFDRFVARRGLPHKVYSDNGTNFKGAERELSRNFKRVIADSLFKERLSNDNIEWQYIPPNSPHFGGIWEAGVKSVKHHLKRILGQFIPTLEEFYTLLCKIEAVLNSRPLVPLNDDPECFDAITPGHFLVGSYLNSPPAPSLIDNNVKYLSRWQSIQAMSERFWKVWSSDYLNSLQQKTKWREVCDNIQVNDVVLLKNPLLPPTKWLLGRIVTVYHGKDGHVRVVKLRTANSTFTRGITELCKLPVN